MSYALTSGQASILKSLLDACEPMGRVPESELIHYERDLCILEGAGLIARMDRRPSLTASGREFLQRPPQRQDLGDAYGTLAGLRLASRP